MKGDVINTKKEIRGRQYWFVLNEDYPEDKSLVVWPSTWERYVVRILVVVTVCQLLALFSHRNVYPFSATYLIHLLPSLPFGHINP